jgi:site-specific DNA-methyltransferase (adenine-specific)
MSNIIINEDSMYAHKAVEPGVVDLILTDIPYVISRANNFKSMGRTGIDFGEWDHRFDVFQLGHFTKFLRKGGSMIVFHAFQQCADVEKALSALSVKDKLFWQKSNPQPRNTDRRYVGDAEMSSWFVKPGAKWTFNKDEDVVYHRTIMPHPIPTKLKKYHPTAKSIPLLVDLVQRHSNPGDLIFDPFAGCFTTVVAANMTNRNCLAFEANDEYYKSGKSLLEQEGVQFNEGLV